MVVVRRYVVIIIIIVIIVIIVSGAYFFCVFYTHLKCVYHKLQIIHSVYGNDQLINYCYAFC